MDLLLSQVHERTGISIATLKRWAKDGLIKGAYQSDSIKIGKGYVWFVPENSLALLPAIQERGKAHPKYGKSEVGA